MGVQDSPEPFFKKLAKRESALRPSVTSALIKKREKELGLKLPKKLAKLLKQQNGGYLVASDFIFDGRTYEVRELPPLSELDTFAKRYPERSKEFKKQLKKPDLIIELDGDGHFFIALDYCAQGPDAEPEVIYFDTEGVFSEQRLASNFDDFLHGQQLGDQALPIRFDEVDPKYLLAEFDIKTNHKVNKINKVQLQGKLFLTEDSVISIRREKWSTPVMERWTRETAELSAIDSDKTNVGQQSYLEAPTKTLFVFIQPNLKWVYGTHSGRTKKGWKNLPFEVVYLSFESDNPKHLEACRRKILAAHANRRTKASKG